MIMLLALVATAHYVTLDAVGDVMLARWVGRRITRQGPDWMLKGVRRALQEADLLYGNLECALTNANAAVHKPIVLRAEPSALAALKGFSILSLVNNHAGDCGEPGLSDASRRLTSAGILSLTPGLIPVYFKRKGIRLGFVGMIDLPGFRLSSGWERDIAAIRGKCDVLLVGIHWGVEGSVSTSRDQRLLARKLAGLGVDAVLGCHPHVLQPVEVLKGKDWRKCFVAFSLGNFVFDARPGPASQSEILSLQMDRSGISSYSVRRATIEHGFPVAVSTRSPWRRIR